MGEGDEVARIRSVYRGYQHDDAKWAKWSAANPGNQAICDERTRLVHRLLTEDGLVPLTGSRVLDVGCGNATELARMAEWGASPDDLYGVDLLDDVVRGACELHPELNIHVGNAERLEPPDESFDVVLLFTVLSSVLDDGMARNISSEVRRVLVPGGVVVWYELRCPNPMNRAVRPIGRAMIERLFPGFALRLEPATLLPPLARRLGRFTPVWYPRLARLRVLQSHYVGLLHKPRRAVP